MNLLQMCIKEYATLHKPFIKEDGALYLCMNSKMYINKHEEIINIPFSKKVQLFHK